MSFQKLAESQMEISEGVNSLKRNCFKNFSALYEQSHKLHDNQVTLTRKADSSLELALELSEKMDFLLKEMELQRAENQELRRTVNAQNNIIISLQSQAVHGV